MQVSLKIALRRSERRSSDQLAFGYLKLRRCGLQFSPRILQVSLKTIDQSVALYQLAFGYLKLRRCGAIQPAFLSQPQDPKAALIGLQSAGLQSAKSISRFAIRASFSSS